MTLVVTHAAGFLACFTRNDDGTMRQRALIDTGEEPPTALELANIGERLANEYRWLVTVAVATAPKAKTVAATKRKRALPKGKQGIPSPTDPPPAERSGLILAYLREHPNSTLSQILSGIGLEPSHDRISRWHHFIAAMRKANQIEITSSFMGPRGGRNIRQYSVVARNE